MGAAGNDAQDRRGAMRPGSVLLNHDLGSFDHSGYGVALFELEFVGAAAGDGAFDEIVSDPNHHMGHDIAELNFFDFSMQFVSG
jgi:hypothetical protein